MLEFDDHDFLPLTVTFSNLDVTCPGALVAEFLLPPDVPSGPAEIFWYVLALKAGILTYTTPGFAKGSWLRRVSVR